MFRILSHVTVCLTWADQKDLRLFLDSYLVCQVKLPNFLFPLKEEHYLLQAIVEGGIISGS